MSTSTNVASKSAKTSLNPTSLGIKVGDIFVSSWGWDQTNIDYYEVVALTAASVKVVEVGFTKVGDEFDGMYEQVVPDQTRRSTHVMTKRIRCSNRPYFRVTDYASAGLWDGAPKRRTGRGYGH
ncbi:hypothetical protein EXE59_09740 [Nocardioides eburneiflavus]|uniref:Uncharacterized protein n=1 Tax=Nocardioides eburneiflavus TaxID=2518372 RepID=A0A4Z1CK50_9ACTN|nr:hypothetical protein [Nocardioides eburneiflavus]TGN64200.1 hypothetical protein EXE59_09740 [Nocardioides eburneiflavus]